jgi:hypothetical protein
MYYIPLADGLREKEKPDQLDGVKQTINTRV